MRKTRQQWKARGHLPQLESWKHIEWRRRHAEVERAVYIVGGMIRTHRLALEQSDSKGVDDDHVMTPWLTMHAAVTVSLFEIGSDGRDNVREIPWHTVPERVTNFRCVRVPLSVGQNTRQREQAGSEVPQ